MTTKIWISIAALTVICFVIKATGPVVLGGRDLPRWAERLIVLLPASLLTALVVTQTLADGRRIVLDARAVGVAVAIGALRARRGMLTTLLLAAGATALVRALA